MNPRKILISLSLIIFSLIFSFSSRATPLAGSKVTDLLWESLGTSSEGVGIAIAPQTIVKHGSKAMVLERVSVLNSTDIGYVILYMDCFSMEFDIRNVLVDNNQIIVGVSSAAPHEGIINKNMSGFAIFYPKMCDPV